MKKDAFICKDCIRFKYGACQLADLEPCRPLYRYHKNERRNQAATIVLLILGAAVFGLLLFG